MSTPEEKPQITLYWLERSRAQRIVWLLEELNLEYEIKYYKRDPKTSLAPPELKEIHPLGKSPVLGIKAPGAEKELILAESAIIIEYLCDHFPNTLVPKRYPDGQEGKLAAETEQWRRNRFFLHYAEGSLMTYLILTLVTKGIKDAPVPFFIKPITRGIAGKVESNFVNPNLETNFEFLENQLATSPDGGPWLCGKDLTAADIMMSFPLLAATEKLGLTRETNPKMFAFVDKVNENPAYQRALKKVEELTGEKYALL